MQSEEKDICALISVREGVCPFSDTAGDTLKNPGLKQSMNEMGVFNFPRSSYGSGVFISFFVLDNDLRCGDRESLDSGSQQGQRSKDFTYLVTDNVDHEKVVFKVILAPT